MSSNKKLYSSFREKLSIMETKDEIYNMSVNDRSMIPSINNDYHRRLEDLLETLSCLEDNNSDYYELWKTNNTSSPNDEFYYECFFFKSSDIPLLISVITDLSNENTESILEKSV